VSEAASDSVKANWIESFGLESWDQWRTSVEKSDIDIIITNWWPTLSHLKTLFLDMNGCEWPLLLDLVKPSDSNFINQVSHLQSVNLYGPCVQGWALLERFPIIPSVTFLSATRIGVEDPEACYTISQFPSSNVRCFALEDCAIGTHRLVAILALMQNLGWFTDETWIPDDHLPVIDRRTLVATLIHASKQRLNSLSLTTHMTDDYACGTSTEALEENTINPQDLLGVCRKALGESPDQSRIGLPKRLKKLTLWNKKATVNPSDAAAIAGILRRAKEAFLPNLQKKARLGLSRHEDIQGLKVLGVRTEFLYEWGYEDSETENDDDETDEG